jgi:hypothetical protein
MIAKISAIAALGFVAAAETGVNPIRKVVTLMQEMQKEVEAEGEAEAALFKKFDCYCKGNTDKLKEQGSSSSAAAEEASAKAKAETSEKKQVDEDLAGAKKDRAAAKEDLAKAQALRTKEANLYAETNADALANLDATTQAISALEKGMGASFMQTAVGSKVKAIIEKQAENMDVDDKETISAFLEAGGDYQPASGQIVGILKNMKDEMEKAIGEAKSAEDSAISSFGELKGAKQKEIAATTDAIESLTKRSGELAVSIVQNKNAAKDASEEAADAAEFLANLKTSCATKEEEWAGRQATRADELEAISKAIAILNEDDALDLFKKTLKTPKTVVTQAAAFLQKSEGKASELSQVRAQISALKGNKLSAGVALMQNAMLGQIKSMQKSGKVDFSKVLKMIDDMVALLVKEQSDDEKSKEWCNVEFDTSDDEKKKLTGEVKSLDSAIAEKKDNIAALSADVAALNEKVASLDKTVAEATAQRKSENAEFTSTLQANNMAIQLIGKAKNKLLQFYNPDLATSETPVQKSLGDQLADGSYNDNQMTQAAAVPAFVQLASSSKTAQPATWEGSYGKKDQKSGSIMALMDKLAGELKTEVKESEMEEKESQKDYEELLGEAQKTRADDVKTTADKSAAKADEEVALTETKRTHALTSTALAENATYIADLHKQCDFIVATFEERREARTNEVEGLKKAKAVLSGASYSFF